MSDFTLVNIVDSQLEDITSELTLPVITGSSSNNFQTFNAQASTGSTQIQFNVQVHSLSTAVSRHFLVQSDVYLRIDFAGGVTAGYWAANEPLFCYGKTNALQAFPLNSLLTTIQSAINNVNVTVSTKDVMAGLLKLHNYEELAKYNSLTPSLIDSFYYYYRDGLGSNNNVLGNYATGSFAKEYQPRGVFPVSLYTNGTDGKALPLINSLAINADDNGTSPYASIMLKFTTTEPLLFLSLFISGNSDNQATFLGLNNLTITMNLGNATRAMSNASYATLAIVDNVEGNIVKTVSSVSLGYYSSAKLLLIFLNIPPPLFIKIEPRNVVNYNQYVPYTYNSTPIAAKSFLANVSFNNVHMNQIPNRILISAMKRQSDTTTYDSNSFLVIKVLTLILRINLVYCLVQVNHSCIICLSRMVFK